MVNWVSASEGKRFAEVVTAFTEQVRDLGPLTISADEKEIQKQVQEMIS